MMIFDILFSQGKGFPDSAEQRAANIFKKMDVNSDGVIFSKALKFLFKYF